MSDIKTEIEHYFERLGRALFHNPLKVLLIIALFLGFMAYKSTHTTVDTSSKAMFRKNDTTMREYNEFLDQFGRSELIIIAIESPNIFTNSVLTKLKSLHNDLEENVPYIRTVNSLINARSTRGDGDRITVEALLKNWPEKDIDLTAFRKEVMANPYYLNNIVSENGHLTAIVIELESSVTETDEDEDLWAGFEDGEVTGNAKTDNLHRLSRNECNQVLSAIRRIVNMHTSQDFTLSPSGIAIIADVYNRATENDMVRCAQYAMISVLFFITILFRRITGIILPLFIVLSAICSTMGLMALFNKPVTDVSVVIPTFLIAVGIADSVHVLTIFYRYLQQGASKEDAIVRSLGHSGLAIVLTSLTTAAGLLSFSFAELSAISEMGIFSAAGVILALLYTILMLPPLIALIPIKRKKLRKMNQKTSFIDHVLLFFINVSTNHPKKILLTSFVIFLLSFFFIFQLKFSHNPMDYFPDTMEIKKTVSLIDREFKGITTLEIVVDTKEENGLYNPDILNTIEKATKRIKKIKNEHIFVGKVFSINDILKECNQALHGNNPEFYSIPENRKTIAQEFLLFENSGSEDLLKMVDSQFSKTRITVKTPTVDAVVYEGFLKDIKNLFHSMFRDNAEMTFTGEVVLLARTIPIALKSMAKSYIIAFVVITFMMIILMGNVKIGLISMIPNVLPIITVMGIMGGFNISLNLSTIMIGSIAIGLVVDDTVHFMYNFQKYYNIKHNTYDSIHETLMGTGRAILITSLILCSGFFVLIEASLNHMAKFGFFTGVTIILALLADFLIAPALMTLITTDRSRETSKT